MKRRKSRYVDQRGIESCIEQLQAVIDGLRSGSMALEEEEQSLLLRPRGLLDFEVRVEQLGTKEVLRLEMSWRLGQRGADAAPASGPREVLDGEVLDGAVWEGPLKGWPERTREAEPMAALAAPAAPTAEMAAVAADSSDAAADDDEIEVEPLDAFEEDAAGLDAAGLDAGAADGREVESGVMHVAPHARLERSDREWSAEDPISSWPPQRSVLAEYHQLYADACTVGSDGHGTSIATSWCSRWHARVSIR